MFKAGTIFLISKNEREGGGRVEGWIIVQDHALTPVERSRSSVWPIVLHSFDCLLSSCHSSLVTAAVGEDGGSYGTHGRQIMNERETRGHWIPARPVLHLRPIATR